MQHSLLKGFHLRDRLIEPASGKVTGPGGDDRHLPPKAVEVLLYLAVRPLELVERTELLRAVWGDEQKSGEVLNRAIADLRRCFDDHAGDPQLIQTVPRRGYRLLQEPRLVDGTRAETHDSVADTDVESGLIGKLMRRGVVQAGLAYLIFGWLLIQVADAVTPIIGLPAWFPPVVTYAAIGGFPVALILAWLLEQSNGRWLLDRGAQPGRMLSGLERNYLAIVVAYTIAAVGAGSYQLLVGFDVPDAAAAMEADALLPVKPNSIAVLKFLNINENERAKVFSEGLGEDILDRLARVPGLSVSSRGDSWSLPDNASSNVVRKRLRVAYFLEGSVRLIGNDLRVVVQLVESATGFHVFSRGFNAELLDHMDVQREITNLTVANLRAALPEDTHGDLVETDADPDVDAYVLYRRGKHELDQAPTVATIERAIGLFERALGIDPDYSAAHAGICQAHVTLYELTKDDAGIARAESACAAALATNPQLGVVHTALGQLRWSTGNVAAAETAYTRALDINPRDVTAMLGMADILQGRQQFDEAERLLRLAIDLQPGNWRPINSLGALYFFAGRYADAAHAYRQVVFLDPDNWLGHGNLGIALMMTGDFEAAIDPLNTALGIENDAYFLSGLGTIYYYLGEFDKAVEIHRQATEMMPESNFVWLNLGDALRFSAQSREAAAAYRQAIDRSADLLETNPNSHFDLFVRAWATAALGDDAAARVLIDRALDLAPEDPYVHYYDGLLKNRRGEPLAAIDALRSAIELGYPVGMLAADPLLGELHGSRDFEALLSNNR